MLMWEEIKIWTFTYTLIAVLRIQSWKCKMGMYWRIEYECMIRILKSNICNLFLICCANIFLFGYEWPRFKKEYIISLIICISLFIVPETIKYILYHLLKVATKRSAKHIASSVNYTMKLFANIPMQQEINSICMVVTRPLTTLELKEWYYSMQCQKTFWNNRNS